MTASLASTAQRVLISALGQVAAKAVHLALNVVSSLVVIHHLAPGEYGDYVLVVTVTATIALLSDVGLPRIAVRRIAGRPESEQEVLGAVLGVRLLLAIGAMGVVQVVVALLGTAGHVRVAALLLSTLAVAEAALSLLVAYHVRLQQQYEAAVRVLIELVETALLLWLVTLGADLVALVLAPVVGATVGVAVAVGLVRRRLGVVPAPRLQGAAELLREAAPVGCSLLLAALYLKTGALTLAVVGTPREVGLFGAAMQPVEYLLLTSAVVVNILLPLLVRAHGADRRLFEALYRRGTEVLLVGAVPVAVLVGWGAPQVARTVFGDDFAGSAGPLRVLSVALLGLVWSFWSSVVLLAAHRQAVVTTYDAAAVVGHAVLCAVLADAAGPTGAGWALLSVSVMVVVIATAAVRRCTGATLDVTRMTRLGVAAGVLVTALLALQPVGALGATVAALGCYLAVLRATGLLDAEPLRAVLVPVGSGA